MCKVLQETQSLLPSVEVILPDTLLFGFLGITERESSEVSKESGHSQGRWGCVCVCVCPSPIPRRARNSHSEIFRNFCHMLVWVLLISISELMENPVSLSLLGVHCGDSSMMRLPHTFLGYLWNKSVPYLWVVCILLSGFSLKDLENGNCLLITVLETSPFTFHNSEWCDSWFKKQIIEILENIWWYKEWIL